VQGEQQRILQALGQRAMAVVDKFAKDNGYNLILDDGNPNTPILYASAAMDITQEIVALYDKTYANNPLPASAPSQATPKTGQAIPGIPR
jgi:hypothetical protein